MTFSGGGVRRWLLPAGAVLLVVAFLLPVIHAPFFSDDVTSSELNGYRTLHGDGLLGLYAQQVWDFVVHGGRPQIFSGLPGYPVFVLLGDHPVGYHLLLLALTALDAALLYGLLRRLRAPAAAAALAVVLGAAWMQLRIYHDSMLSFAGLVQVMMALVIGSLWLFARWLDEGRTRDLGWAVGLFFVACGIYEVAYSLCAAHVALALVRRGRAGLRASAPFVGVALAFAAATFLLRQVSDSVATGYTTGGSGGLGSILSTYAVQLVSPLPATSIVSDSSLIGGDPSAGELFAALWRGLAAAGVVTAVGIALARDRAVRWAPIVAVGLGLYFAPPVLLSVSAKYQAELSISRAYLPVLIQVFGLALLATAGLGALLHQAAGRGRALVVGVVAGAALFAGVSGGVTAFNNVRVLGILQPERDARRLVEAAAERGVFGRAPPGSSLFFSDADMRWQGPIRYGGYPYVPLMLGDKTGRAYDARVLPDPASRFVPGSCRRRLARVQPRCASPASRSAWARVRLRADGGSVVVAPLVHVTPTGFVQAPTGRTLTVYRQRGGGGQPEPPRLIGRTPGGARWTSDAGAWTRRAGGKGWARWELRIPAGTAPVASSLDDDRAFVNFAGMPEPPARARLMGTRRLLP